MVVVTGFMHPTIMRKWIYTIPAVTSLICCLTISVSIAVSAASPAISTGRMQQVSISAPWPTSCLSPVAEGAEFVAEGSVPGLFWEYVEALGNAPQWLFSCSNIDAAEEQLQMSTKSTADTTITTEEPSSIPEVREQVVVQAMMAAGHGYGRDSAGVQLDDLSLRLMELALYARCVMMPPPSKKAKEIPTIKRK